MEDTKAHKVHRPVGVVVLAGLFIIIAGMGLLSAVPALLTAQGIPVAFNAVAVGLSGVLLFIAWGLWTLQRWALYTVRTLLAIDLVLIGYNFIIGGEVTVSVMLEGAFFAGLLLYTFVDAALVRAFEGEPQTSTAGEA